jgi:hypothetical protein
MARSFADYQVLPNGSFTLDAATAVREKKLFFDVPEKFKIRDDSRKPILAFHAAVIKAARLKVRINAREVLSWNLSVDHTRGLWCAFNGSAAWPEGGQGSDPAPVEFELLEGKVEFSQVVMWYQVEE